MGIRLWQGRKKWLLILATRNALPPALLLADRQFHAGVIGIVAGRLKDKYRRPCFVVALDDENNGKGSARSVASVDIGQIVAKAVRKNVIAGGGGHAMAAGVTLADGQLAAFETYLDEELGTMSF